MAGACFSLPVALLPSRGGAMGPSHRKIPRTSRDRRHGGDGRARDGAGGTPGTIRGGGVSESVAKAPRAGISYEKKHGISTFLFRRFVAIGAFATDLDKRRRRGPLRGRRPRRSPRRSVRPAPPRALRLARGAVHSQERLRHHLRPDHGLGHDRGPAPDDPASCSSSGRSSRRWPPRAWAGSEAAVGPDGLAGPGGSAGPVGSAVPSIPPAPRAPARRPRAWPRPRERGRLAGFGRVGVALRPRSRGRGC